MSTTSEEFRMWQCDLEANRRFRTEVGEDVVSLDDERCEGHEIMRQAKRGVYVAWADDKMTKQVAR